MRLKVDCTHLSRSNEFVKVYIGCHIHLLQINFEEL